ncbi:F124B protein, partial [Prunella fulvescens]|nr:F124B protein [Prunella fulvescens]
LPVWGVRRARRGPELLRVTLHCSFDNYEDAVRLYELLLQQEGRAQRGRAQRGSRCVLVLQGSPAVAVQLCLQQLPPGALPRPAGRAALQFGV